MLAPATLAALPSTRAIPDRDVFYVAFPKSSIRPLGLTHDHSHCPRACASYPNCVAVYPRDSRSHVFYVARIPATPFGKLGKGGLGGFRPGRARATSCQDWTVSCTRLVEWSEWDERHGRRVGITTWEECLAVERCRSSRDTNGQIRPNESLMLKAHVHEKFRSLDATSLPRGSLKCRYTDLIALTLCRGFISLGARA
jgi:hypothetical protein